MSIGNQLSYCLLGLLFLIIFHYTACDPYLVWTQKSHMWARLRGVMGPPDTWLSPEDRTLVGSIPDKNRTWYALAQDPVAGDIYWHDRSQYAFYRQPAEQCLQDRSTEGLEVICRDANLQSISSMAVDWNTKAVYFTEDYYNLIGVTGIGESLVRNVHQILFSTDLRQPMGIVLQPDHGLMYWLNVGMNRLERSNLYGTERSVITDGNDISNAVNLAIDSQDNAIYWSIPGIGIKKLSLHNNMVEQIVTFQDSGVTGLAVYQDFLFVGDNSAYAIDIYEKTGGFHSSYIIDADPFHLVILEDDRQPTTDCSSLRCEQLCIRDENNENICLCGIGYQLEIDGRSCTASSTSPSFIYSRGTSLWRDQTVIHPTSPHVIHYNETLVSRDKQNVQPIGFNYNNGYVVFGDTQAHEIYIQYLVENYELPVTVNTRQNQGISVDWLTDTIYWSDYELGHIMCSRHDGRYHRIVLDNLSGPRGLSVDPSHGVMFWCEDGESDKRIMRGGLDGTGISIVTSDTVSPQGLTADPRSKRLYWTERSLSQIVSIKYDGTGKRTVLQSNSNNMYDLTIWKDYISYTQSNDDLRFGFEKTGLSLEYGRIDSVDFAGQLGISLGSSYDVVAYDSYLQPQASNLCGSDNGGCGQLCTLVTSDRQPSTATSSQCTCAVGFQLSQDTRTCVSEMQTGNFVLFVDPYHKQVYEIGVDGQGEVHGIPLPQQDFPISLDVDPTTGRVYWIDEQHQHVKSSTFYGHDPAVVWSYGRDNVNLQSLVVDYKNNHIYATDTNYRRIVRFPMNGRDITANEVQTIADGLWTPHSLTLDSRNGYLYWTDIDARNVVKMSYDGTVRETIASNINQPSAITVTTNGPDGNFSLVLWSDQTTGRIQSYDPETDLVDLVYENSSLQINTIASDGLYIYFSAWNEKGVYRWEMGSGEAAHVIGAPVFARIYDLHVYMGEVMTPLAAGDIDIGLYAGFGGLAFILLALLAALLGFLINRNSAAAPKQTQTGFDNTALVNDAPSNTYVNSDIFTTMESGPPEPPPLPYKGHIASNSHATGHTSDNIQNGHVALDNASSIGGVPAVGMIPLAGAGAARKVKLRRGRELPPSQDDPLFVLSGNAQATVIQRLANKLRNRLSSVRFSRPTSGENTPQQETNIDTTTSGEVENRDTKPPPQKGKINYQPQLHRPPRGFAPASRVTPSNVKTTWNKTKFAGHMNGKH